MVVAHLVEEIVVTAGASLKAGFDELVGRSHGVAKLGKVGQTEEVGKAVALGVVVAPYGQHSLLYIMLSAGVDGETGGGHHIVMLGEVPDPAPVTAGEDHVAVERLMLL